MASIEGTSWSWSYEGGAFEVEFRVGNIFYCPSYPAISTWTQEGNKVVVDWKNFGTYDMVLSDDKTMAGAYRGYPDDWRKASLSKTHSAEERAAHAAEGHPKIAPHVHTSACNH